LYDLYMMSCVGGQSRDIAEVCVLCGCAEKHVVQRRMATMPSVLLLQLCRDDADGGVLRHPVYVDET
jgi:hypothetical protein